MTGIWHAKDLIGRERCPSCEEPANGPILTRRWDGLSLRRCSACALLFLDPAPSESALVRCYAAEYFCSSVFSRRIGPGRDYHISAADIDAGNVRGYTEVTENFDLSGKAILEVGCATGALLGSLRKHSPSCLMGIDIAAQEVAYGRKHYGLDLRCTKLEEAGLSAEQFDLVVMLDVIEHVGNVCSFFSSAARCLKLGGAMLIRTPNADSYRVAGPRWLYLHHGLEHVVYFSEASLTALAHAHGMVIERLYTEGCPAVEPHARRRSKLGNLLFEPGKVFRNRLQGWKLASAPEKGYGLDICAILRRRS
jgi:2-polyprenyl-3-methyl-5-hydroxy-6-metoxy-1,4-benzoquinol methylase